MTCQTMVQINKVENFVETVCDNSVITECECFPIVVIGEWFLAMLNNRASQVFFSATHDVAATSALPG